MSRQQGLVNSPVTTYTYALAAVPPGVVGSGARATDVEQGSVGDCYFLSAAADLAQVDPSLVASMFIINPNGTYTVEFQDNGNPFYETVNLEFPQQGGNFVFADRGQPLSTPTSTLWVPLLEKAYAQANQSGWTGRDGTDSYWVPNGQAYPGQTAQLGINFGLTTLALTQLTGHSASAVGLSSAAVFQSAVTGGQPVSLETSAPLSSTTSQTFPADGYQVVYDHEYSVVGYNSSTKLYTLYNPWGFTGATSVATNLTGGASVVLQMTYSQIASVFSGADVGTAGTAGGSSAAATSLTVAQETNALSAAVPAGIAAAGPASLSQTASSQAASVTIGQRKPIVEDRSFQPRMGVKARYLITIDDALAEDVSSTLLNPAQNLKSW